MNKRNLLLINNSTQRGELCPSERKNILAGFSLLMGEDVPPRRAFIEANATYATIDA